MSGLIKYLSISNIQPDFLMPVKEDMLFKLIRGSARSGLGLNGKN